MLGALIAALVAGACSVEQPPVLATPTPPTASGVATPRVTPTIDPDAPRRGGALRIALGADPSSLDPRHVTDDGGLMVVDALFDSLVALDASLTPQPSLATSWTVADDQRTWTFSLDPTATFHDGTPVTSADVIRAWQSIADGTGPRTSWVAASLGSVVGYAETHRDGVALAGLEAPDEHTLVVHLSRPEAELLELVAHPSMAPIPPAALEEGGSWRDNPVGNGPFRMAEAWAHNQFVRLSRADDDALLDEVLFRIYADDPGQVQQYQDFTSGQLHMAEVPSGQHRRTVEQFGRGDRGLIGPGVLDGPRAAVYLYGFDTSRPPFDDPAVRRAVALLIDRAAIADEVFLGTRAAATSLVPPGIPGAQPGACDVCHYDPDRGGTALQALLPPIEEREPIVLLHNSGDAHALVARRIAAALTAVGMQVEVREADLVAFVTAVREGEANLFRAGLTVDHLAGSAILRPLFHSEAAGVTNLSGYHSQAVDALLDEARMTPDRESREDLYRAAEALILEDLPMIPIVTFRQDVVVAAVVRGFTLDASGRVDLAAVWLSPT